MEIDSSRVFAQHVRRAAAFWRSNQGYHGFQNARHYEVEIDGERYPIKAITAIALELAGQPVLMPRDFPGRVDGRWHTMLRSLGFDILDKAGPPKKMLTHPSVTSAQLYELLVELRATVVITKNKNVDWKANFHVDPTNNRRWFNGEWRGTPRHAEPKEGYVLHWSVHDSIVCIGRYLGARRALSGKHQLIMDHTHFYRLTDLPRIGDPLHAVLIQKGPPTYSYLLSSADAKSETTVQRKERYRLAQLRLEQPAFRKAVIAHHGGKCVVTGCAAEALLDAAHLPGRDWRLGHNKATDGIPLRADLHRALDRGLIRLNSRNQIDKISPELQGEYDRYLVKPRSGESK
ncbi:HNH endonuclease [Burkholderia gladioli]|uniref:HNH endonuclease n=1 Tax=Burkholderia gladioli TaxID=28095 RepID=A0A2A7S9U0_BURGA|nr:HNH endonuclease signature motif containing protein [Burkholderia gladioli]PEH40464.1 HNH endonuclease [Burkholderia gladioli]